MNANKSNVPDNPGNFRIAVVGDSIAWGQGLLRDHKYAFQVAAKFGKPPAVEVSMQPHSGAVIGVAYHGGVPGKDPEVPEAIPTILSQIDQVPNPATIDLVLVNGGINDVGVETILNLLTKNSSLYSDTINYCYRDMKTLLSKVVSVFTKPTCRFRVTGYFPILSSDSNLIPSYEADHLGRLLGLHGLAIPLYLDREPIVAHICSLTEQFWHESEAALSQGVAEITSELKLGERMMFVQSPFSENNALFASEPWLFGFGEAFAPEDEVADQRAAVCNIQYSNPLELVSREICYHASVGHPNLTGASAMAKAILNSL